MEKKHLCMVTKEELSEDTLIAFVLDSENNLVPDIFNKLPGKKLWIKCKRCVIEEAINRSLFDKEFGVNVKIADDLFDVIVRVLERSCFGLLTLGKKSGDIVSGFQKVKTAIRSGKVEFIIEASDAAQGSRKKLGLNENEIKVIDIFNKEQLSYALAKETVVHIAVMSGGMAKKIKNELNRFIEIKN